MNESKQTASEIKFHIERWLENRAKANQSKEALRRRTKSQVYEMTVLTKRKNTAIFLATGFQGLLSQQCNSKLVSRDQI